MTKEENLYMSMIERSRRWLATAFVCGGLAVAACVPDGEPPLAEHGDDVAQPLGSIQPALTGWSPVTSMSTARDFHTATLLDNGTVLVVGGRNLGDALDSVELYDPVSNTWTVKAPLLTGRWLHTATLLSDGRVLVIGGEDDGGNSLDTAEVYDPRTDTWDVLDEVMNLPRAGHTATLLPSDRVLIAGGFVSEYNEYQASAELYVNGVFQLAGDMLVTRALHAATRLPSNEVLVTGGRNPETQYFDVDLFKLCPETLTCPGPLCPIIECRSEDSVGYWEAREPMQDARNGHTATLLSTGEVFVVGGVGHTGTLATAERYDGSRWSSTISLGGARYRHTASVLASGQVLIAGGQNSGTYPQFAELYDPSSGTWTTSTMITPRARHAAVVLSNGHVLVVGGFNSGGYLASAEKYEP